MPRRKKYLISGGAGFIGTNLALFLIKKGHSVIIYDNMITGRNLNLGHINKACSGGFLFVKGDVCDKKMLFSNINGFDLDGIFHLASIASPPQYVKHPIETMLVGSIGTHNLLEMAVKKECRFLFTSTSEVYGDPEVHPQKETYNGSVNLQNVRSCYDESKRYGEAAVFTYGRKYSLDTKTVRLFNSFGPFLNPKDGRAISNFVSAALENKSITIHGSGDQTRSFCYVDDTIEGIWQVFNSNYFGPVNIGNPYEEYSVKQLWELISAKVPNACEVIFGDPIGKDPQVRKPDISLIEGICGWKPKVDLSTGLDRLISFYKGSLDV